MAMAMAMDFCLLESKISHVMYSQSHYKLKHHNNIMSFSPLMSLKPSNYKANNPPKITSYSDKWLDVMAINHLSHNLQAAAGIQVEKEGYDGLMEACNVLTTKFNSVQQQKLCLEGLKRSIPSQVFPLLKALIPPSKFTRELLAQFTALFFAWLVGPSELMESEFDGRREKNVVHVKKCRFLESSNCVGMCTNLCKFPTQKFIKESLGMPITMVPNFEDMSCDMKFGEEPPASDVDPATKQPCYQLCKMSNKHNIQK